MIKNEGGISTAFTLRLIYVKLYIVTKFFYESTAIRKVKC